MQFVHMYFCRTVFLPLKFHRCAELYICDENSISLHFNLHPWNLCLQPKLLSIHCPFNSVKFNSYIVHTSVKFNSGFLELRLFRDLRVVPSIKVGSVILFSCLLTLHPQVVFILIRLVFIFLLMI